jgi:hypothetical protein
VSSTSNINRDHDRSSEDVGTEAGGGCTSKGDTGSGGSTVGSSSIVSSGGG